MLKNIGALEFVGIDHFLGAYDSGDYTTPCSPSCPHQLCLEKHCVNSTQGAFASMHSPLLGFTTHAGSILWGERIKEEGWGKQRVLMPSH